MIMRVTKALLIITRNLKQLKCLTKGIRFNKLWYIYKWITLKPFKMSLQGIFIDIGRDA